MGTPNLRLTGTLVDLRPLQESDLDRRLEMVNNEEVQKIYVGRPVDKNTKFDLESWFYSLQEDPFSEQWAIETKDGTYVGDIDLHSIHVIRGEAWITPMIGDLKLNEDPAYRREAIELIAEYAFKEHGIERLQIDVPSTDRQGLDILRELGFVVVEETQFDFIHDVRTVTLMATPESFRKG